MQTIILCRLILSLRQVHLADGSSASDGPLRSSFLRFASRVVGNLGAPVDWEGTVDAELDAEDEAPRFSDNPLADGLLPSPDPAQASLLPEASRNLYVIYSLPTSRRMC